MQIVNFNSVQAKPTLFQFLLSAYSLVSASLQTLLGLWGWDREVQGAEIKQKFELFKPKS